KAQRGPSTRKNAYQPKRPVAQNALRPRNINDESRTAARLSHDQIPSPNGPIVAGTPLSKVLHTSHLSLTSSAGTDEQFVDRTNDLVADDQTTFDNVGGSFDIAVGKSGTRYEVYSATLGSDLVGILVAASDTNGDYVADTSLTFNLRTNFMLPSAAAVVAGNSTDGKEFVVVCSSGFFETGNPSNEPPP